MPRNWTQVGSEFEPFRPAVERQIAELTWEPIEGAKPAMPALGLQAVIHELHLPRVSQVALDGYLRVPGSPADPEGGHYSIYGIECRYSDGPARVYVIDKGTVILPLCSEHFPAER